MTRSRRLAGEWVPALVVLVAGIAIWEGIVRGFGIENFLLPAPSDIVQTLWADRGELCERGVLHLPGGGRGIRRRLQRAASSSPSSSPAGGCSRRR